MVAMRSVRWFAGALLVVAVAALLSALAGTTWQWGAGAFVLDPIRAVLLSLVAGVGTVVATYSARNLVGQQRLARYAALEAGVIAALAVAVSTTSLVVLAVAWTVASWTIAGLVAHADTKTARRAGRQVRARLLVGDALVWAAVVVMGVWLGAWTTTDLATAVDGAPTLVVVTAALLVVGAGVVRSALVPAHRWLPETAEAPSPVSALLHAGFVNGVGVLCLLLWPLIAAAGPARVVLVLAGVVTAAVATAQMRTRADLKGRLAASTSSQMGYLAIQVGIGIPAAVLAHVVGHGVWKAAQFLGAGDAIARARKADRVPARVMSLPATALVCLGVVVVVAAAAMAPVGAWPSLTAPADLLPLGVALGAAWLACMTVARSPLTPAARVSANVAILAGTAVYLLALRGLTSVVTPVLGEPAHWSSAEGMIVAAVVVALFAVGGVATLVDRRARDGRAPVVVRRMARGSLRPWTLRERLSPRPQVSMSVSEVTASRAEQARHDVDVAVASIGPLYPLTSFVASNPLAGLEDLPFRDAGQVASQLWGAATGPSGAMVRRAIADGRVTLDDVDAVIASTPSLAAGDTNAFARRVMTADDAPAGIMAAAESRLRMAGIVSRTVRTPREAAGVPVPAAERALEVANHCCARAIAGAAWPGADGPWAELRASAAGLDQVLGLSGAGDIVATLPADASEAIAALLDGLALSDSDRPALIGRVLAENPGWVAHLQWRIRHAEQGRAAGRVEEPEVDDADLLIEVVATRLVLELAVAQAYAMQRLGRDLVASDLVGADAPKDLARLLAAVVPSERDLVSLDDDELTAIVDALAPLRQGEAELVRTRVLERAYRFPLETALSAQTSVRSSNSTVAGQVVTCIDVRSERLRRHLEQVGPWETYGTAGFFGLPVRYTSARDTVSERSPALLRPTQAVVEDASAARGMQGALDALSRAVRAVEGSIGLVFGWAEAVGWLLAPAVLLRTLSPRWARRLGGSVEKRFSQPTTGRLVIDVDLDAQVDAAVGFLATTALHDLAPVVVICGHGATVTNNPHVAAYDCGACGGSAGDVSARTMVSILNDPRVRHALGERGWSIPDGTRFVAAVHDTTTDVVRLIDDGGEPDALVVERLLADAARAADGVRAERLPLLPGAPRSEGRLRAEANGRAADWAQPRPEWGLAGAAAIVIGPRALTSGLDLEGRVFLQSYSPDHDPEGEVLEQLLAAPAVVAQWITSQYWASVIDPDRFGAGDKTTHNVIGDGARLSAVVSGARGDLRIGLPWQAVSPVAPVAPGRAGGDAWQVSTQHSPQRLTVVVYADTDVIDSALGRQRSIGRLVAGEWIVLIAIDPESGSALTRESDGRWVRRGSSDLVDVG